MRNLTSGNIYKTFILFALPIMITALLGQMFSTVDTIIAGKMLGEASIAAIGGTASLITLVSCAISGYAVGFSVYVANLFGAGEYAKIKQSLYSVLIVSGGVIVFISAMLILFSGKVADLLKVNDVIRDEAISYFSIYCVGLIFMLFQHMFTCIMHALGETLYPLIVSVITQFVHVGGSVLLVIVLNYNSVNALAIAAIFSNIVFSLLLFVKINIYFKKLNIPRGFKLNLGMVARTLKYSLPTLAQQIIMYTSDVLMLPFINSLSVAQVSAYSVSGKVKTLAEQTYCSSSKALSNYAAQCIGAGKTENIKKGVRAGAVQGLVFLVPILLCCIVFAESICRMFFAKDFSEEAFRYSVLFLRVFMPFITFNVINNLFHSFFRGIKAMNLLLLITSIGSLSKYLFARVFFEGFALSGIYLAIALSWIVEAIACIIIYFGGVWQKYIQKKTPADISSKN